MRPDQTALAIGQGRLRPAPRQGWRRWLASQALGHVDDEAIADIVAQQPVIGFVDLVHADRLDFRVELMFGAEIEHFLGFRASTDARSADRLIAHDEQTAMDRWKRLDRADDNHPSTTLQQLKIGLDVVADWNGVEDE